MSHLGEVIASSAARLTAHADADAAAPRLGAFVTVETPTGPALAVVVEVRRGSFETGRRPVAYGLPPAELHRQQPQLRELLATEFEAVLIGHHDGLWRQLLPPLPPLLHSFVESADDEAVRAVTERGDWVRTLLAAEVSDDILAAAIRAGAAARTAEPDHLVALGQALARALGDDYDRLRALLRRIVV